MKHIKSTLFAAVATVTFNGLSHQAQADTSWKKKIVPMNKGVVGKLPSTRLDYKLSWNGTIGAGQVTFDFNKRDKRYPNYFISQAYGRSTGVAYGLFPYSFSMTSFVGSKSHKSVLFVAKEEDNKAKTDTKNKFNKRGVTHSSTRVYKNGNPKRVKSHLYRFANSHDPLSAIQYIRSQPLKNGDKFYLSLHPFDSPMFAEIRVIGRENHNGKKCIKMDVKLSKVDIKSMKLKTYKKLKKATLWISDDANRYMMELRSKVFIGDVRMTLKKARKL